MAVLNNFFVWTLAVQNMHTLLRDEKEDLFVDRINAYSGRGLSRIKQGCQGNF